MDVNWDVVGLGIRHVCTVGKVESDVEKVFLFASIVILRPCSLKMVHRSFLVSSTWRGGAFVIPRPSSLYKPKLLPKSLALFSFTKSKRNIACVAH